MSETSSPSGTEIHNENVLTSSQKALALNLNPKIYGTSAEIGAGQEVARWFFKVGGAAGTVAKTMSAYDMDFSDAIYGTCDRYVSRERLETMLNHEFNLLIERLDQKRGAETRFFAFADTVKARSYMRKDESHGWAGIRFQHEPRAPHSEIILHVRMLDDTNLQQQEALGILGVNLIYGAFHLWEDPGQLLGSLLDNVARKRVNVDMVKVSGPAFEGVDNRLLSLLLVQKKLTDVAMFMANGEVVQPADVLYKQNILVLRGHFRPITNLTMDLLRCARAQFIQEPGVTADESVELMEMTLQDLSDGDGIDYQDFLDRVDQLRAIGANVLISNYIEFHRLAACLFRYTKKKIGIAMGLPTLRALFDEGFYKDLEGGILESFGRLFKNDLKLFVHPQFDPKTQVMITAGNIRIDSRLRHLYAYLYENHFIQGLKDTDESCHAIDAAEVLRKIQSGDESWKDGVPAPAAREIAERKLFGCP